MPAKKLTHKELRKLVENVVDEASKTPDINSLIGTPHGRERESKRQDSKRAYLEAFSLIEQIAELNEKLREKLQFIIDEDHWDSKFGPASAKQSLKTIDDELTKIAAQLG